MYLNRELTRAGMMSISHLRSTSITATIVWTSDRSMRHSLVFRWLAIPWIQSELNAWVALRNQTAPRADCKKILPHGIPELMQQKPEKFGVMDFKVWCSFIKPSPLTFASFP